jgi:regulator of sigma E protease
LNTAISIIEFILALGTIILLHEFGHFVVGRLSKIEVEEFGIGFPPRALKLFTWKETLFTLNWIPFGGFCKFKGEEDPQAPGGLSAANKWARLATLLGGPIMNLLLASILFAVVVSQIGMPRYNIVQISEVTSGSPAANAGISSGDILVEINGQKINSMEQVISTTKLNLGKEMNLIVSRNGKRVALIVTPRSNPPAGQGAMGILLGNPTQPINIFQAFPSGIQATIQMGKQLFMIPSMIIQGQVDSSQMRLVSPKGIYDMYAQVRTESEQATNFDPKSIFLSMVSFFGVVSAALGFSNLLPIPAVDGGRIFFMIPELLFNKKVPAKFENAVHAIGFTILLAVMAFTFIQDFINPIVLPK